MSTPLILIGGGEHARVVAEAARSQPAAFRLLGFVDPQACEETVRRIALTRLGAESALADHPSAWSVIAVGTDGISQLRATIAARLSEKVAGWASVVHAHAWVSPTARLGQGCVVMAGAVIQCGAELGAHCIVNSGAVVEHDVQLGDFVHVAPGAVLGGGAIVGDNSFIGLGARVRDHVRLGREVMVGMGAAVVEDVPEGMAVKGVPAR